jgi:RNA polymerase sigma-70 factor (ECF subfamily)
VEIMTAHDLLMLAHRGDQDAAVRLYRSMAPRMLAYARTYLGHDAAAEDAVQQVFVGLFARPRDEIEGIEDVLAWLIRLTRNAALNDARGVQRRRLREAVRARFDAGIARSAEAGSREELVGHLGSLPDDARELIVLKHIAGLTFDQIAFSLDANRSTIASRYRAAMDQLRAALPSVKGVHHV